MSGGKVVAWLKPDWQNPENFDGLSPVTTYERTDWHPLVLQSDLAAAIARAEAERMQSNHLRRVNDRLMKLISSIHMRCAPADTTFADGRTMRFIPPDPEFYWRELSAKVNSAMDEMRAAIEAESTYEAAIAAQQAEGEDRG